MKNILLLTSTNLAANPRLVKELRLAVSLGFSCTVIQFGLGNWSDAMTDKLESEFSNVQFITISALRHPFLPWFYSTCLQNIFQIVPTQLLSSFMLSVAVSKRSVLLFKKLKRFNHKFDWVIAHNPPAFYPAFLFARNHKCKLGIDIEDYHPGESLVTRESDLIRMLMRFVLPHAEYCSYAAPLIAEAVIRDVPCMRNVQIILLNGFSEDEFVFPQTKSTNQLKLVWYSQHISYGRGLENVLQVTDEMHEQVELHLIGNLQPEFGEKYLKDKKGIVIHPPMHQKQLHKFLSDFDVGLALDIPVNPNRDIALTNKIISYAQAGLMIIAMHTQGQDQFLDSSRLAHIKMNNDKASVKNAFLKMLEIKSVSGFDPIKQFNIGLDYRWEYISVPLKQLLTQ